MRITRDEIESTIEMFVNSIYDEGEESGWLNASLDRWIEVVYKELTSWKSVSGSYWTSNENRFDGKANIINRIKPLLKNRLNELKAEGYDVKAI